jgi:hypothetical protein
MASSYKSVVIPSDYAKNKDSFKDKILFLAAYLTKKYK